jgi:hypothetical protein
VAVESWVRNRLGEKSFVTAPAKGAEIFRTVHEEQVTDTDD